MKTIKKSLLFLAASFGVTSAFAQVNLGITNSASVTKSVSAAAAQSATRAATQASAQVAAAASASAATKATLATQSAVSATATKAVDIKATTTNVAQNVVNSSITSYFNCCGQRTARYRCKYFG